MASVTGFKKMNWFPRESTWKTMEAQRQRRREMFADFQAQSQQLAAGFSQAASIQIQGAGEIAARAVQAQVQAKAAELNKQFEQRMASFNKLA